MFALLSFVPKAVWLCVAAPGNLHPFLVVPNLGKIWFSLLLLLLLFRPGRVQNSEFSEGEIFSRRFAGLHLHLEYVDGPKCSEQNKIMSDYYITENHCMYIRRSQRQQKLKRQ